MGLFDFWKGNSVNVERDRNGVFTYSFLDQSGFTNSDKYLELSISNPVLLAIIALRSKIYSQMRISHIGANGNPIENSPIVKLFKQPNYFQSQEDFLFQQMWFLSANGTNLTYKVDALSVTKAIYNLLPSEIDLNNTHKVKSFIYTKAELKSYETTSLIDSSAISNISSNIVSALTSHARAYWLVFSSSLCSHSKKVYLLGISSRLKIDLKEAPSSISDSINGNILSLS